MSDSVEGRRKRGLPSQAKAKEILRHGEVHGKLLSDKQEGLMGVIASGKQPTRMRRRRKKG